MRLQGREGEAGRALQQAQRFRLSSPALWAALGDTYTQLGRFDSAADCLARAAAAEDGVQVWMCSNWGITNKAAVLWVVAACLRPQQLPCSAAAAERDMQCVLGV